MPGLEGVGGVKRVDTLTRACLQGDREVSRVDKGVIQATIGG